MRLALVLLSAATALLATGARTAAQPALRSSVTGLSGADTGSGGALISATGSGDLLIAPDRAIFMIMIDSDGSSAAAASAENARAHAAVMAALMKAGASMAELSTSGYSLQPRPQYSLNASPAPTGYRVSSSVRVEMSRLDSLGAWIDAALAAGATRIGAIQFEPRDPAAARQQALAIAVRNAHADAVAMAKAAGGTLGPLKELSVQPASPRPIGPLTPLSVAELRRSADQSEIRPPDLRIEAIVLGRWGYRVGP